MQCWEYDPVRDWRRLRAQDADICCHGCQVISAYMQEHNLSALDLLRNFTRRVNTLLPPSVGRVLFWDEMFDNLGAEVPKMAGKAATIEVKQPPLLYSHHLA